MYLFGAGNLYLTPPGTTPTPVLVGTLQEVSLDISFEIKELHGNKQFPVMVARGKGKISGKAKSGEFRGGLIQAILSGSTKVAGYKAGVTESKSIPAATPYTVTVDNSATFAEDNGVVYADTGNPLTRVTTAPSAGQYSLAAGVYTFAAADSAKSVQISYSYTIAATGSTISYSNQLMGDQTIYALGLYNKEPDGSLFGIKLPKIVIPKLALGFKNDDYTMPDLDISAFADATGKVIDIWSPEQA